jgi:hypothetical protein
MRKLQHRLLGEVGGRAMIVSKISVTPGGVPARRLKHVLIGHDADPAPP